MADPARRRSLVFCAILIAPVGCGHDVDALGDTAAGATGAAPSDADGDGDGATASVTGGGSDSQDAESGASTLMADTTDGFTFDVGSPDGGRSGSDCECGVNAWSYIWVANSVESTVSKINTRTMEEEGRYVTRPDGAGNPSRTSVSLNGHMAAIANRSGGVVSIWAREELCTESNGVPGIQTSTGKDDVLAWGEDECVAWYTAFDQYATQRPVVWAGQLDPVTCRDTVLWTSGCNGYTDGRVWVHRLDGETGGVVASVEVEGFLCGNFGAYGGVTDSQGDLWMSPSNNLSGEEKIAHVDLETMEYELHEIPDDISPYGITLDAAGRVWMTNGTVTGNVGAGRFDPMTGSWTLVEGFTSVGGIQAGSDGRVWAAARFQGRTGLNHGLAVIDAESATVQGFVGSGGSAAIKGVGIDLDGYGWMVPLPSSFSDPSYDNAPAHKVDPDTLQIVETYVGLHAPYTYSDMAGGQIANVACTPAG